MSLRISRTITSPNRRGTILGLLLVASSLVFGCDSGPSYPGLSQPVDQAGPYAVGFRTFELTYTPPGGSSPRVIPVVMWYPADAAKTAAMPTQILANYLLTDSYVAIVDAPRAEPAYPGGFPVIVHSHGHFGHERQSYWLGEGLAAHGFVVVAPGHVGDRLPDFMSMVPAVDDYYLRVTDVIATLDMLENLAPGDTHAGLCNTDRVVMTGHSRGTNTVWAALGAQFDSAYVEAECSSGTYGSPAVCPPEKVAVYDTNFRDPRIVGGIPMAGSGDYARFGGFAGMNSVTTPVFEMSGSMDLVGADLVFANVTTPEMTWAEFVGGCHDLFGFGFCGSVDPAVAWPVMTTYVYAFARHHIFQDTSPEVVGILDGTNADSSIVTYRTR